jgi:hypothetical protein
MSSSGETKVMPGSCPVEVARDIERHTHEQRIECLDERF